MAPAARAASSSRQPDPGAKDVEELTNDVKKELGRNQTIQVNAWEHHEGRA